MGPLRRTTLGLKGPRSLVGHRDGHDLGSIFGALTRITGPLTTRLVARPRASAQLQKAGARPRRWQAGWARHWRDLARADPAPQDPRVGLVLDNAPWPRGALSTQGLKEGPHWEL